MTLSALLSIILGAIAAVAGALMLGRRQGKTAAQAEQAVARAAATDKAHEIDIAVGAQTPAKNAEELEKWSRG